MLGHDRIGLRCPVAPAVQCPKSPCPGAADPAICAYLMALAAWRAVPSGQQEAPDPAVRPAIDPAIRDAVNACPDRGPVLPLSEQDDCGCRGRELTGCRAGKGARPGRVTLRDCLDCRASPGRTRNPSGGRG